MNEYQEKKNLLTIIALSGNRRMPDLEEEIFTDRDVAKTYLRELLPYSHTTNTLPELIYSFTAGAIKERMPVAEKWIKEDIYLMDAYLARFSKYE